MSRYIAEFVGTFVLVFTGCAAAVLAGGRIGDVGISLAFGLALLAMVYTVGHVSGCHINPAVTLGLFISNKMPRKYAPGYWISQVAGGIVAAGVLLVIAHGMPGGYDPTVQGLAANGFGAHSPGHYNLAAAALTEFVLTFVLVITVIGATDIDAPIGFAGIPIGLALLLANLVAIPVTNASINPARSIGPAVFVAVGQSISSGFSSLRHCSVGSLRRAFTGLSRFPGCVLARQNARAKAAKSSQWRKGLNSPKDQGGLRNRVMARLSDTTEERRALLVPGDLSAHGRVLSYSGAGMGSRRVRRAEHELRRLCRLQAHRRHQSLRALREKVFLPIEPGAPPVWPMSRSWHCLPGTPAIP